MDSFAFESFAAEDAAFAAALEHISDNPNATLNMDDLFDIMAGGEASARLAPDENRTPENTPKKLTVAPSAPARAVVSARTNLMPSNAFPRAHSSGHEIATLSGKPGPAAVGGGGGYQVILFGDTTMVPISPVRGVGGGDERDEEDAFNSTDEMNITEFCVAAFLCKGAQLAVVGGPLASNRFALPGYTQAPFEHSASDASPVVGIGCFVPQVPFALAPSRAPPPEFFYYIFAYNALTGKAEGQSRIFEGTYGHNDRMRVYYMRCIRMKAKYVPDDWETGAYKYRAVVADGPLGGPPLGRAVSVFMSPPFRLIKCQLPTELRGRSDNYVRTAARVRLAARAAAYEPAAKAPRV